MTAADLTRADKAAPDTAARMSRIARVANLMDTRYRIPGTPIRVGWDSILGLVPGIGDLATTGPAAWMIYEAHGMGARKRTLARMAANSGLDLLIGGIPLIGDAFDLVFKANRRNLALLEREFGSVASGNIDEKEV